MYDILQCMPTVPGAIGAFRREALEAVGGISADTLAEDTDLTNGHLPRGLAGDLCSGCLRAWTEAPGIRAAAGGSGTAGATARCRRCGNTECGARIGRGRDARAARVAVPLLAFQVLLPLLAPVIDIAALYAVVVTRSPELLYAWLGFMALQLLAAAYAFRLDGEPLRPLWSLPLQQIVYRQLMYSS